MNPAIGDDLLVPLRLNKDFYQAIRSYGSGTGRAPALTVVEHHGKLTIQLTYGKLLSRSCKIAYCLLTKTFRSRNDICSLKFGDPVALAYTQNDPINFVCAFYGCLLAELVPIPVDPPLHKSDGITKETGDLLRTLGVRVCLSSEVLAKCLALAWEESSASGSSGWSSLHWMSTQHLARPPKEWTPSPHFAEGATAYFEVAAGRDGCGVRALEVTHSAMLRHCRALAGALHHSEGETCVCLVETRRGPGLWHAVFSGVLHGMHTVAVAKPVADSNPTHWMYMVAKYRASIALVTSRDLERCLLPEVQLGSIDQPPINLSPLRLLVVCDAANPWSFPVCDSFLEAYSDRGLRPEAVCPTAASPETLTVSIKRPISLREKCRSTGNIGGASFSLRRMASSDRFQMDLHCGQVLPGSSVAVVQLSDPSRLCRRDEVGEICVASSTTAAASWTTLGTTSPVDDTFRVEAQSAEDAGSPTRYTRSGLIGFLREDGYVFVCGSVAGLMVAGGRCHNADDVVATVAAAVAGGGGSRSAIVSRSHIAVFAVGPTDDGRLVVVTRQHPDWDHDKSLKWLLKVLRAVDSLHHVAAYCVALVPDHHLPKSSGGEVNIAETRRRFLEGSLHPTNILIYNPRLNTSDVQTGSIGSGSDKSSHFGSGKRRFLPSTEGPPLSEVDDDECDPIYKSHFLLKMLEWRSTSTSDEVILTQLNGRGAPAQTVTSCQLYRSAGLLAALVLERAVVKPPDTRIAVVFQPGIQLISAFYACLYIGAVPVVIQPPASENPVSFVNVEKAIAASRCSVVLADHATAKVLKSKAATENSRRRRFLWPVIVNADDVPKKTPPPVYHHTEPQGIAYMDFNLSPTGRLIGIEMSHFGVVCLCRSLKTSCELYSMRPVVLCLDPYSGLGLALWCLSSVFSGHHSILIPPTELESNPALWVTALSQYSARDTFCSYGVMMFCTEELKASAEGLKAKGCSLRSVRWCVAVGGGGRPRQAVLHNFAKTFAPLGLRESAVGASFGCRANVAVSVQNASSREPLRIYVDKKSLKNDKVKIVERGTEGSECIVESGKLLPGVRLAVVNPETKELCSKYHIGEIWVDSGHNAWNHVPRRTKPLDTANGFQDVEDFLRVSLADLEDDGQYARTGYLGFVLEIDPESPPGTMETSRDDAEKMFHPIVDSGPQHAVFIVGALDETVMFKGLRYHHIFNRF